MQLTTKQYQSISYISGPLLFVEGAHDLPYGAIVNIHLPEGGIRGGQVIGASDKIGAFPVSDPVDPVDIQATIYHCMGLPPHLTIYDQSQRPWTISSGKVVSQLV